MQYPQGRILILAKAPVAGLAKTRLIPAIGAEQAARLQQKFIEHTVQTCIAAQIAPVQLWCAPHRHHPVFHALAKKYPLTLHDQGDGDLGKRMFSAIASCLQEASFAILIGTDCPQLDIPVLQQSARLLTSDHHAVVAPATDGGYVLIGMNRSEHKLFDGIPWGTHKVMQNTRERLEQLQWRWQELRQFSDIDLPEDLKLLKQGDFSAFAAP